MKKTTSLRRSKPVTLEKFTQGHRESVNLYRHSHMKVHTKLVKEGKTVMFNEIRVKHIKDKVRILVR